MITDKFDYHHVKPGNHNMLKGFILALFIHGVLFFIGGKHFIKPVQYSIQPATGSIDVDLVTPLSQSDTDAVKSTTSTMEKQPETVKPPQSDADAVKPITPIMEKQLEAVKIAPQEEQAIPPQPDRDTIKPPEPATVKRQDTAKTIQPSSQGTIRIKSKPGYFQNQPPEYPQRAKQMHQEGLVILRVEVDQKGMPVKVEIEQSSGYQLLDQAALKAVRHWRFQPEQIGDRPIESKVAIPIRFRLEE